MSIDKAKEEAIKLKKAVSVVNDSIEKLDRLGYKSSLLVLDETRFNVHPYQQIWIEKIWKEEIL